MRLKSYIIKNLLNSFISKLAKRKQKTSVIIDIFYFYHLLTELTLNVGYNLIEVNTLGK